MQDGEREQVPIGIDIEDAPLRRAVLAALAAHSVLALAAPGQTPRLVITDHAIAGDDAPALLVGDEEPEDPDGPTVSADDADLILSAAHVMAAGYRVGRRHDGFEGHAGALPHLTPRERQVLELLVGGASNKHIALALDISVHTAKFHVAALLDKLGARNRSDAVGIALRGGYVTL